MSFWEIGGELGVGVVEDDESRDFEFYRFLNTRCFHRSTAERPKDGGRRCGQSSWSPP